MWFCVVLVIGECNVIVVDDVDVGGVVLIVLIVLVILVIVS